VAVVCGFGGYRAKTCVCVCCAACAVQIYIGAPNIREYTPGRKSFIDIRAFKNPEDLAARVRELDANINQYMVPVFAIGGLQLRCCLLLFGCSALF
jgi:hypothetical protein